MLSPSTSHERITDTAQAHNEMVEKALRIILPSTVVAVWLCTVLITRFAETYVLAFYVILALVVACASVAYRLYQRHLSLAVGIYLFSLVVAVTIIFLSFRNIAVLFLYAQIVLIAATLTGSRFTWGLAFFCTLLMALFAAAGLTGRADAVAMPSLLTLLTALISWLHTRRLLVAVDWSLTMFEQAQQHAQEAQQHRAALQRALKSLDEAYVRLERTNEALLLAREAAEKAYQFKAEFVANVSHELRTPLNLIVGFSEMMVTAPESYKGVVLPQEYRADALAIHRGARHLADLINDVLDLSQIESGRMPLSKKPEDLRTVIDEAVEIVRGLAEARGLKLLVDVPDPLPVLQIDRTRIRQVLLNLLTNATRFTDAGWIRVTARLAQKTDQEGEGQGEEVTVTVADSGRGIAPYKLARAFEAFSQLHDNQAREGSGLGLALSKKFIAIHGGRMWIESEVGRGTTVGFTLDVPKNGRELQPAGLVWSAQTPRYGDPVVMLLHDDARALALLSRYVEGYQFVLADSVPKALQALGEAMPVAVLGDGDWINNHDAGAAQLSQSLPVPMIICPLPGMKRIGAYLGAADYLTKPVTREQLCNAMSRLARPPGKVLIVDDDPDIVLLVGRMLKGEYPALQVVKAFDGREALRITREQRPDVVVLDLLMPDTSGYDFLEELAHDAAIATTPIIIMSARGMEEEAAPLKGELRVRCADGFSTTQLLHLLQSVLGVITKPVAMAPTSAEPLAAVPPA